MLISDTLSLYLKRNPGEKQKLSLLQEQVKSESYEQLISRKNFVGHITGSAFIVSKSSKRVLLLEHKSLRRMLQPGGHVDEADDGPLGGAYREAEEETGVQARDINYRMAAPGSPQVPFYIDTQRVPANRRKGEPSHYHHDFWYLFLVEDEFAVHIDEHESDDFRWVEWREFAGDKTFEQAAPRIEQLMAPGSAEHFFESTYRLNFPGKKLDDIRLVVVTHIVQNSLEYLVFLRGIFGDRLHVFAKPNSINQKVYLQLQDSGIRVDIAARSTSEILTAAPYLKTGKQKSILLDVGGYFHELATQRDLNILGIIEDTENGLKKYMSVEDKLRYPVISVARSTLKENEDKLVGESIVHATDTILRTENRIIDYMACTVVGYGKIGSGIAGKLKRLGIKPVVLEKNPQRLVRALNDNCIARPLEEALHTSEVVFCATGTKSLSIHEFRMLRSGAYVVSVTSSDDEFDLLYLDKEYEAEKINEYITKYTSTRNYFYLVNDGNPVNFLFGSALNGFINLILSEGLFSANALVQNKNRFRKPGLYENSSKDRDDIASLWLAEFAGIQESTSI